ncbi:MAG: hypothetical protein ACOXZ5_03780 [Syntrophomonadaceae bacterium]|jgi:hypothetical protein
MKLINNQLQSALKPILKHLLCQHLIKSAARGLALAGIIIGFMLLAAHFFPWVSVYYWCVGVLVFIPAMSLLVAYLFRPGWKEAAVAADAKGLKERAITALEAQEDPSIIARKQREDALFYLKKLNAEYPMKVIWPIRELQIAAGAVVFALILTIWPNPMLPEITRQQQLQKEIQHYQKEIEKLSQELEKKELIMPEPKRRETMAWLDELNQRLSETRDLKELLRQLSMAETSLEEIKKSGLLSQEQIDMITRSLEEFEPTGELVSKVAQGDIEGSQEAGEQIEQDQGNEVSQLSDIYSQLDGQELENTVRGETGAAQMLGRISSQIGMNRDIRQASQILSDLRQSITGSTPTSDRIAQGNIPGTAVEGPDTGGGGGNQGQSGVSASGQGAQGQSGQGNSPGSKGQSGTGNGQGVGAGAGTGQDSGNNQGTGAASGGSYSGNKEEPVMNMGRYELIYDPDHLGLSGEASYVQGQPGEGYQETLQLSDSGTLNQSLRPYREVIGHYSRLARESLDRTSIPAGVGEIVRDYFSSLEE